MQIVHAGKRLQEDMMIARIIGDHRHAMHGFCAISVDLKCRVPKIFREMMLARRKAWTKRARIMRKNQRERELYRRSIGPCSFAGEVEHVMAADAGGLERARILDRIAGVEHQHRETLTPGQKVAIECAE